LRQGRRFSLAPIRLLDKSPNNEDGDLMKYMLLFCGTREAQRAFDAMTPAELAPRLAEVGRWFAENQSRIIESNQLAPPESATTVHLDRGDEPLITNGPYLEGNEVIGGYAVIDADDLDDALAMATTWPGGASIEVRPISVR
jgi:hypothetical protein